MPFYQYSAIDAAGKPTQGTIQATSAGEAIHMLIGRGFRGPKIVGESASGGPAATPAPQRRQQAPMQLIHQAAPPPTAYQQGGKMQINAPAPGYHPQTHHTQKAKDRDIFFLFAQIAEQLRAGIGPVNTFSELSHMYKDPKFRDSLGEVATAASEGRQISSVLQLWPDLYPEHVVGLIRAGETGGFLPEAATTVAEQAEQAHKFKRFHWWIWAVIINALLSFPLAFLAKNSFQSFFDQEMANGGKDGGPFAVFLVMWHQLLWPWGPITLLLCLVSWGLRNWFSTRGMKRFRHEVGLRTPVLGQRARDESVTIFSWVLAKLARGGVPPNRAWELAVESVPNLSMQDKLKNAGVHMNEGSKISDVVFKSDLFPQEYAPVVATGELTGDISGALERLSQISRTEYEANTVKSKVATGSAGCTGLILTMGLTTIIVTLAWAAINHTLLQQASDPDASSAGQQIINNNSDPTAP
ncbi:MAG TPA: type II secretion system F family protein [Fimbriimonadaceae bacterium]|jgi:type II secretory pathway component PulF